jgi:hypothetical protein
MYLGVYGFINTANSYMYSFNTYNYSKVLFYNFPYIRKKERRNCNFTIPPFQQTTSFN